VTAPLRISFEVACSPEHAFRVWTSRIGTSRRPESGRGGIYERTSDGTEHEWGEVTVWQPPHRLAYLWHLGLDRARATEVDIRFVARGSAATMIEIEQRGWERLGEAAERWRDRNRAGWQSLLPHFRQAAEKGEN